MYRVKETITSLAHGKQFMPGAQLYGNEFPAYAFDAMVAGGVIEEIGAEPAPAERIEDTGGTDIEPEPVRKKAQRKAS